MKFENNEAEEYYLELKKEFGNFHANYGNHVITMESLLALRKQLIKIMKEYS